jgi:hypothetical protein
MGRGVMLLREQPRSFDRTQAFSGARPSSELAENLVKQLAFHILVRARRGSRKISAPRGNFFD